MTIDTKLGRELLGKATGGEWGVTHGGSWDIINGEERSLTYAYVDNNANGERILPNMSEDDARWIAWARNNAEALLTAAEQLTAAQARVKELEAERDEAMADARRQAGIVAGMDVEVQGAMADLDAVKEQLTAAKRRADEAERELKVLQDAARVAVDVFDEDDRSTTGAERLQDAMADLDVALAGKGEGR